MKQSDTIISLAEVRDRVDLGRSGAFTAKIDSLGNKEETVYYASPYGSNGEGAFIAVPEEGTTVLVCQPKGSSSWYYLGTTFMPEPKETTGGSIADTELMPVERADPRMYAARGLPMRYIMKSPEGQGLTISDEYTPEYINKKVELESSLGKKVTLHDSPAVDSIVLDAGPGSRIILSDNPNNNELAPKGLQVETTGPQKYLNLESQTDVVVGAGGRELQLLNNADGILYGEAGQAGNVNIQSKYKDVNVFTQAEQGKIFIECLNENGSNQHIVIETNGAGGGITIKTKGAVFINADDSINIDSGADINMKSLGKISMESNSLDIRSGPINIDGDVINLASNLAQPNPPGISNQTSQYGNTGITTY